MSEPIPESIPASAKRTYKAGPPPKKRRALSPKSQTASQLEALFAKPEQHIPIPSSSTSLTKSTPGAHVPEIVQNVQGSSAGAGSGEFHVYKASRRREYERLRGMEEEVRAEEDAEKWERERKEREERDAEITRKKREKRKNKGKGGKKCGGDNGAAEKKMKSRIELKLREPGADEEIEEGGGEIREEVGIVIHDDD